MELIGLIAFSFDIFNGSNMVSIYVGFFNKYKEELCIYPNK